jgi:hypothetical protein
MTLPSQAGGIGPNEVRIDGYIDAISTATLAASQATHLPTATLKHFSRRLLIPGNSLTNAWKLDLGFLLK